MSGGGGQALVGKWGRVPEGGIDQIFANWGDHQSPQGKNPAFRLTSHIGEKTQAQTSIAVKYF